MRKLAQIENGIVVNVLKAPDLKTEIQITEALQNQQAVLMQVKNDDESPYYSANQVDEFLAALDAELRLDPWADCPEVGQAGIGWTYDTQSGAFAAPVPVETFADLSKRQFEFMLALTGFGDVWDDLASAAKAAGDLATYAGLVAERAGSKFRHDVTLETVAKFRPGAPVPTDSEINAAWKQAEAFKGVGL